MEELFRNSRENLECDFCNGAGLQISHEGIVVKLMERLMRDNAGVYVNRKFGQPLIEN